jgi:hypothetical protein
VDAALERNQSVELVAVCSDAEGRCELPPSLSRPSELLRVLEDSEEAS